MKHSSVKTAVLCVFLCAGIPIGHAQIVTVGPTGTYATPCQAFPNLTDGETVQIDANGGVPYNDSTDCTISANNLTIIGVNGRPVMDGTGLYTNKGLWVMNGHDNVVDNIEFRNATGQENAAAIRIQVADGSLTPGTTDGGNITVQHSYLHDINGTIILGGNANQYGSGLNWYSSNPYITFQYDEFAYGGNADAVGNTHNMYMGYGGNMDFTLQYSWTHDSFVGHTIKTRAPYNNILYDMITDATGTSSFLLDFCLGGSNYVVGNAIYKGPVSNGNTSQNWFIYADQTEDGDGPEYDTTHQDLHFVNNTVIDDPSNTFPSQFISVSCPNSTQSSCPAPSSGGPAETIPAVIENNIFVGPSGNAITNQSGSGGGPTAYMAGNIVQTYSSTQLAADFVDWSHYDFHLASGSPAIQAGIYPPTNNTGAADSTALATSEFLIPNSIVPRPTPTGNTMDAGAYSYPRSDTPPSPSLSYTSSVTVPGTGTITITGLPTPSAGQYNYAAFVSENTAAVPNPPSADSTTGTITTTYSAQPSITTATQVPIDIYVMGVHLVATVTVNPGPPVLSSITQDWNYQPFTTVHLEGPAPAGGTVIDLNSSDTNYLYVPSTVTVPEGAISAETGSATGSLWGQSPADPTETITATQGGITKTVSFTVFNPAFHSTQTEYLSISGGAPLAWCVVMVGDWPIGTNSIQVTSSNQAVIPNQTVTYGYSGCNGTLQGQVVNFNDVNFDGDIAITTNPVSTQTTVNVTLTLNGDSTDGNGNPNTTAITVTPAPPPPTSLVASTVSASSISLSWTASNGLGVTYNVYRDSSSGFSPYGANQVASGLTGTTYTDTGLVPGTPYYYVVEAVNTYSNSQPSNMATATTTSTGGGGDVIAINAGGSAITPYMADVDYANNGSLFGSVNDTINTSYVLDPAPQAVYQSQRYGQNGDNVTYTVPDLTPGMQYIVRLHFAETYFNSYGSRQFDIVINGTQVMTNFDIVGSSGGQDVAVVEPFLATADSNGNITISLNNDAQNYAAINGIEIQTAASTNPAASVSVVSGSGQTAVENSAFTNPLVVLVTDGNGNPVQGVTVTFAGSGLSFPNGTSAVTDSNGHAQVTAEPTSTGSLTITASVYDVSSPAIFSETGTALQPTSILPVSGSGQSALVGTAFTNPLVVLVLDSSNNPVPGTTVTFAGTGVGFPNGATAVTDSSGEAQVTAKPTSTGSLTVTASAAGVGTPASFSETGTAGVASSISVVSGSGQSAAVGYNFTNPLVVLVVDANSNPVQGATVTFAGTGVGFPNGATAVTGSNGQAQVTAEPTSTGSLTVTASVAGVGTPASFSETGTAGVAAAISVVSGSGQSAPVDSIFINPLVVLVVDANSHPVSGVTVTFAGTGVSFPNGTSAVTNSSGEAQVTAEPTSSGTLTITASVAGVSTPASFSETGTALQPSAILAVSGAEQSAAVGSSFSSPLVALVVDSSNHPVSGVTVTFAGTGVSFPSGATAVTPSSGEAQVTAEPTSSGTLTITASVAGVSTPASFSETGTGSAAAAITVISGSGQSAAVGATFANPLVVLVADAGNHPVSGAVVTFAGTGVGFPNSASAVTNSSGEAQIMAEPSTTGSLTITASVAGVGTPASFSETGAAAVDVPIFSLPAGTYTSAQTVSITDATPGAVIYYTTDGTTPTTASTQYSAPIAVSSTETLEAVAVLSGSGTSLASTVVYTIPPNYSLTINPGSLTVTVGQTGNTIVTLNSVGKYSGTVIFNCSNLPVNATCTFTQNSVQIAGNNQSVTVGLAIVTSMQTARLYREKPGKGPLSPVLPALAFWLPGAMAGFVACGKKKKSAKRTWIQLGLIVVLAGSLMSFIGCGNGTPQFGNYGTSNVLVTATPTSGSPATGQSATLSLTISPQ